MIKWEDDDDFELKIIYFGGYSGFEGMIFGDDDVIG